MMPRLVLCWILIALMIVGAFRLRSRSALLRLGLTLVSLVFLSVVLLPLIGSTLRPGFAPDSEGFEALSEKVSLAVWWILVARATIISGQILLKINHQHHAARLASDLAAGAIHLGAMLAIIDLVFGISVTGLVATSGIIAIVLGLALQSTLGDLFSGIAIGIERPFGVGDLIWIEGAIEGRVVETNWRSTRIATAGHDIATVPNSVVAKSRILNRSAPSANRTESVTIVLDPAVPPQAALALLRGAALTTPGLTADQDPSVVCTELQGEGATYEISFSAPLDSLGTARSDLLHQVFRHLRYGGVALATLNGTQFKPAAAPDLVRILEDVLVLQALDRQERITLAAQVIRHQGAAGERIFIQGEVVGSLFIIASGAFEVSRDDGVGLRRLGTIGPGDYFGELALLTGIANAASVTALTPYLAYEVTKAMIAPLLDANPNLLQALEGGAAKAQALIDRATATQACAAPQPGVRLLDRIRAVFDVKDRAESAAVTPPPDPATARTLP